MNILLVFVLLLSAMGPLYAVIMGVIVRRGSGEPMPSTGKSALVVALVPCLNEGAVVVETIRKLLLVDDDLVVMVIDDGSDDETPDVLAAIEDEPVYVVRRDPPDCRQGKGAALNYGLSKLRQVVRNIGIDPSDVVVAVFDADGEADPETMNAVRPWFEDPEVGAVQVGVRINNRGGSVLARMQDIEFAAYTEIFQYARNVLTSTGLGGNGQFVRLSALQSLGANPWSDCLTEDLDLGIRLRLKGWRSMFDGSVAVHQQGIHETNRLIRQRTRWFQGHLQLWHLLPQIWRSKIPTVAKVDMSGHLLLPVVMLVVSVGILASLVRTVKFAVLRPDTIIPMLTNGPIVPWWYLVGFLTTPMVAVAYWRAEPSIGFLRGLLLAHLYTAYSWIWFPAGWKAVWRQIMGAGGWVKTARTGNETEEIETGALAEVASTSVAADVAEAVSSESVLTS